MLVSSGGASCPQLNSLVRCGNEGLFLLLSRVSRVGWVHGKEKFKGIPGECPSLGANALLVAIVTAYRLLAPGSLCVQSRGIQNATVHL